MAQQLGFGPYVIDSKRRLLLKDGAPVPLGQRGLALLEALVSAEGRIVAKAQLMDIAWPGQMVEESNLSVQIATLRKFLGTRPDGGDWITTIPRVGYQIIPFDRDGCEMSTPSVPPEVISSRKSIAVLPFTNLDGDSSQDYFSDGLTEDLITELCRVAGLSVISRGPVMLLKGQSWSLQQIGTRLNVTMVLEGSIRRAGDQIRINVQLAQCADGTSLWAERFDRKLTDIFAIQDEIARAVAAKLKLRLLDDRGGGGAFPTSNMMAYDYCLQGRQLFHLHTTQHVLMAKRIFQRAIEVDPDYAHAYAWLANALSFLYANHHADAKIDEMLEACNTALKLQPQLADAHAAYGIALVRAGRPEDASAAFERAIALNPNLFEAHFQYTEALHDLQDWEKAAECYIRALEIAPEDYRCQLMLGQIYRSMGRLKEAEAADRAGLAFAERFLAVHPDVSLAATFGAGALARLGEKTRALEWIDRALLINPNDAHTLYNTACCLAIMGENEHAMDLLERWASDAHPTTLRWIVGDIDFEGVRGHPRFLALLARVEEELKLAENHIGTLS